MIDFSTWASADPLTVEQAAALWVGCDPSSEPRERSPGERTAILPRFQMLTGAIISGKLRADTSANPLSYIGSHGQSLVMREDLIAFAKGLGEKPAFLFDTMLTGSPREQNADPVSQPRNKGGRPTEYDWNGFTLEIIRIAAGIDGLPDTQAELANKMREWFIDKYDEHPANTTLEDRIRKIYQYVKHPRKLTSR
jgi:hypothetical protein